MVKFEGKDKNSRIMNMVVILIWLVVFLIIALGIIFPLVYVTSLKKMYLREQGTTINITAKFLNDFMAEQSALLAASANMDFLKDKNLPAHARPELRGVEATAATIPRKYFQSILDKYRSFRFFAYLTGDTFRPIYLQPYQLQTEITLEQYTRGYLYREWAAGTLRNYQNWDKKGFVPPFISNAFLSQPGEVPAISISVAVVDENKEIMGVLYANMGLDRLSEYIQTLIYGKTGKVFLVDAAGQLLAHPDIALGVGNADMNEASVSSLKDFTKNPMIVNARKGVFSSGVYRYPESGRTVLASYQVIPSLGWIIVLEQDVKEAFSIVNMYIYIIILLVFITILVSFIVFVYVARETAESTRERRELLIISETDPLTGLLNRRSMLSRMVHFIAESQRNGQDFVIAMFDIDDFKLVNDTYGHIFGDTVLREIAARTVSILRVDDLLFRWGGEEFLLVIKNCDLVRGRGVAEKIRRVVCDTPISDGTISKTVTVTIGLCRYSGGTVDSLILQVDEALYEGKRNGKNKIVVGGE